MEAIPYSELCKLCGLRLIPVRAGTVMLKLLSDQTMLHAILFSEVPLMATHLSSEYTNLRWNYIQFISCTAAMAGNFSRSFCVTATRTVITLAAGPVIRTFTMGPEISTSSRPPPPVPAERNSCETPVVPALSESQS